MFQATVNECGDWIVFRHSVNCAHVRCETFW